MLLFFPFLHLCIIAGIFTVHLLLFTDCLLLRLLYIRCSRLNIIYFFHVIIFFMVGLPGVEPGTSRLSGVRSNQLS